MVPLSSRELRPDSLLLRELFGDNWAVLRELYDRRDELPTDDIFVSAAVGNVTAVESLLAADPSWAIRVGGPGQTQAITYAAFGRFYLLDNSYSDRQQLIVKLLLSRGADPNASVTHEDGHWSALYGCCRQTGNPAVAKLLLEAGANPDDGESLYHSSELSDVTCLELILAAGVPAKARDWCIVRALDSENPTAIAVYLKHGTDPNHLHWALFRGRSLAVIQLLVEHGADVNEVCKKHWLLGRIEGLTPVQVAERTGAQAIVEYLLARGANDNLKPADRFIGACWRESEHDVSSILQSNPGLVASLPERDHGNVATAARAGRLKTVQLMLDAGLNIEAKADDLDATALNYAATTGDAAMVDLLLARGARVDATNKHGGDAVDAAVYCAAHFNRDRTSYARVVRSLLAAGAKIPPNGLELALEYHLNDVVEALKAYGAA